MRGIPQGQKGEKFADLARKYSDDKKTAEQGGFQGVWPRDASPKEFREVLLTVHLGDVGGPVKGENEWYIIKINDDRETIEGLIRQRKLAALFEKTIDDTRKKMYVDVRMKTE